MKKLIFIFLLIQFSLLSQNSKEFSYLVGSNKVVGYSIQTRNFDASNYSLNTKVAPILQIYVLNKDSFIGGILENEKGQKTIIKDILLNQEKNVTTFKVMGKQFSNSFNIITGAILSEEKTAVVFYTANVGVWKIYKR